MIDTLPLDLIKKRLVFHSYFDLLKLISMTAIILHISHYLKNNILRLNKLNEHLARRFKLFFYKMDVLGNRWIGLDIFKRKLVFVQQNNKKTNGIVVNLKNLESCTLKKQYDSIEPGGLKSKKLHEYLKTVILEFRFINDSKIIVLSFFEKQKDKMLNILEMEAKALEWQRTISSLLVKG
jgi:hypothetical protein